jgi:hypothetical protein
MPWRRARDCTLDPLAAGAKLNIDDGTTRRDLKAAAPRLASTAPQETPK